MKKLILCAVALCATASSAYAAANVSVTPLQLTSPAGYTDNITFDSPLPTGFTLTGGAIQSGGNSSGAEPAGDNTAYLTANSYDPAKLTSTTGFDSVSLYWGSIDSYNTLSLLDKNGNVIQSFTGSDIVTPANGNQTAGSTNARVEFDITGLTSAIYGLEFQSGQPAFEADNIAFSKPVGAVPEPASWAMMIGGLGLVGSQLRRGKKSNTLQLA